MARVTVTQYECEHDLLPAVCVKCGEPADDHLVRTVRMIDERDRWAVLRVLALLYGVLWLPPLLLLAFRGVRSVRLRIPVCNRHRVKAVRGEKIALCVLVPVWIIWAVGLNSFLVFEWITHGPGVASAAIVVFSVLAVGADAVANLFRSKGGRSPPHRPVPLTGVHPAFVAALVEDRARDRVVNPDRRAASEGVRADFDDEPV